MVEGKHSQSSFLVGGFKILKTDPSFPEGTLLHQRDGEPHAEESESEKKLSSRKEERDSWRGSSLSLRGEVHSRRWGRSAIDYPGKLLKKGDWSLRKARPAD